MLKVFSSFASAHDDFIHDLSYDYYGKRLASCSSDQKLKIYDQVGNRDRPAKKKNLIRTMRSTFA